MCLLIILVLCFETVFWSCSNAGNHYSRVSIQRLLCRGGTLYGQQSPQRVGLEGELVCKWWGVGGGGARPGSQPQIQGLGDWTSHLASTYLSAGPSYYIISRFY